MEYIRFIDSATYSTDINLADYLERYSARYNATRGAVIQQCETILNDPNIWTSRAAFRSFWTDFAYVNEYDSLHGMFLTSGRWYTNAILPIVSALARGFLARTGKGPAAIAPDLAVEVITPEYVVRDRRVSRQLLNEFARYLRLVLRHCDQVVLDIFAVARSIPFDPELGVSELALQVKADPSRFGGALSKGVFPPFVWHELVAEKSRTNPPVRLPLMPTDLFDIEVEAIDALRVLKHFEADYNTFNYKGYFPLVSKYFWWRCIDTGFLDQSPQFVNAVLGDRFYEALAFVKSEKVTDEGI
ncbi:hypothetical protein AB0B31_27970 [Catellatospora citrea]|uniref:hypothetical protein n=1 Tax=Catellatospora citrea TaxID=53366 RepID=UPI0033E54852